MGASRIYKIMALTTAVVVTSTAAKTFADAAQAAIPVTEQVKQLEHEWNTARQDDYYFKASRLAVTLDSYDRAQANEAAVHLLSNLLARQKPGFEVEQMDLLALEDVGRYVMAEINLPVGDQKQKITAFGKLLGRIRAELVPNYKPRPMPRGIVSTGDKSEKEIQAELRANDAIILTNKRQQQLQSMEATFSGRVVDYLAEAAGNTPSVQPLVRQAIKDARLTDAEKAKVTKSMR